MVRSELVKISVTSQLFASHSIISMLVCLTALVCNPFLTTGFDKVGKPQQLLLRLPQLYSPARSRSSARFTLEKVVIDHMTVYACNCSVNPFTIVAAKPLSVVFPFLAVYTSNADTYSLLHLP